MHAWDADVTIDQELVRGLLVDQFPDLDASSARLLAEGWDNSVWLVEERWSFRFPRRAVAVPLVQRELDVLPKLAPLLDVPIPVPAHVGRPTELYRWPFFGCRHLPGSEPADAVLTDDVRIGLGGELGRFLHTLHSPEVLIAVDPARALPIDPNRRADMPARVRIARDWLAELEKLELWRHDSVEEVFDEALALPPPRGDTVVLVHGDLHFRHFLVEQGALAGVIDWGDVCHADPSVDLQLVWSFLPPAGRAVFSRHYGPLAHEQRVRARVLAIALCAALCVYGRHEGFPGVEREALSGLERTMVDWD